MHQFSYFLLPYKQNFYSDILIDYRIVKLSAFLYYQNCPRTRRLYTTNPYEEDSAILCHTLGLYYLQGIESQYKKKLHQVNENINTNVWQN